MKDIALSILANSPETHLILLLVDERPEEVTDFKRSVNCEIYSSTFDENPMRHTAVAELVSDRAKRLVELHRHVVILLDSITRLSRGYNNLQGNRGRTMSGGVDSKALHEAEEILRRRTQHEEGGSLTILATALVETNSRMDDLIFEEFKGTGNMELRLDRGLSDKRVFPAILLNKSGTRREELLLKPKILQKSWILRKLLYSMDEIEAMEFILEKMKATKNNLDFFDMMRRGG